MFSPNPQPSLSRRLTAVLGMVLVVFLNVLVASPSLHARLHGQEQTPGHVPPGQEPVGNLDHVCAITLFAHGVIAPLLLCPRLVSRLPARSMALRVSDWLIAGRPRYRLMPSHGPPAA